MKNLFVILVLVTTPALARFERPIAPNFVYTPPSCSVSPFIDVPAGDGLCRWIQQLYSDGVTAGCGGGKYCPSAPVTRGQMAVFLETAMRGTATWSPWQGVFKRTILVNADKSLTDLEAGTALIAAMNSITDNATRHYIIKLEPRGYDLGSSSLTMKANVALEGSGRENTVISSSSASAAVIAVTNSTLRNLRISSFSSTAKALDTNGANGILIESCELSAHGSSSASGLYNSGGSFTLRDSIVTASGSSGAVVNALSTAGGSGFRVINSDIIATESSSDTPSAALSSSSPGSISGGLIQFGTGSFISQGIALSTSADLDVAETRIEASGASTSYGVKATTGTLNLRNVRITVKSSPSGVGASFENTSATRWLDGCSIDVNVLFTATGISSNGFTNLLGTRVRVIGDPSSSTGISVTGQTTSVDASRVESNQTAINATGSIRVGGSLLGGTTTKTGAGSAKCIASWDESYDAVASNCV